MSAPRDLVAEARDLSATAKRMIRGNDGAFGVPTLGAASTLLDELADEVERLREEVRALAHDLRWNAQTAHTTHAARAGAIAEKYGATK